MRGRMQAVLVAVVGMALSLIMPPLSYISGAVVGLVALRRGWRDGAIVMALAMVAVSLLMMLSLGHPMFALVYGVVVWLPVLVLTQVLRRSVSLQLTFIGALGIGLAVVVVVHVLLAEPVSWWRDQILQPLFANVLAQGELSAEQRISLQQMIEITSQYMTGIVASALVLSSLFSLFIARWWQALLYNPDGFGQEFRSLRLGKTLAAITVLTLALSYLQLGSFTVVVREVAMLLLVLAVLQGVALVHAVVALRKAHVGWLVGMYLLMFAALPQIAMVLAVTAVMDAWLDLRRRLASGSGSGPPAPLDDN